MFRNDEATLLGRSPGFWCSTLGLPCSDNNEENTIKKAEVNEDHVKASAFVWFDSVDGKKSSEEDIKGKYGCTVDSNDFVWFAEQSTKKVVFDAPVVVISIENRELNGTDDKLVDIQDQEMRNLLESRALLIK